VAWALLFARLFDAFVDPLMAGSLTARRRARGAGRCRAARRRCRVYGLFAPPQLEARALLGYLMLLYTGTFLPGRSEIPTTARAD
jgi:hypothetical protein